MEEKITNIKERILQISDFYKVGRESFFSELGISYGNFKGKSKNTAVNSDFLAEILTKYADIDPHWLILGKGEILKQKEAQRISEPSIHYNVCVDYKNKYFGVLEELTALSRETINLQNKIISLQEGIILNTKKRKNNHDAVHEM